MRAPSSNAPRGKMAAPSSFFSAPHTARAPTPRKADGTRPPDQRWASADLSQGPAYKSRPGLFSRQGPNRGAGLRQADRQPCRAVSVSRDRQRLRRLLSCLPTLKPHFRFVLSVPLSRITFLSPPMADSTQVQLSLPADSPLPFLFSLASKPAAVPLMAESLCRQGSLSKAHCRFSKLNSFVRSF